MIMDYKVTILSVLFCIYISVFIFMFYIFEREINAKSIAQVKTGHLLKWF